MRSRVALGCHRMPMAARLDDHWTICRGCLRAAQIGRTARIRSRFREAVSALGRDRRSACLRLARAGCLHPVAGQTGGWSLTHTLAIRDHSYSSWLLHPGLIFARFDLPIRVEKAAICTPACDRLLGGYGVAGCVPTLRNGKYPLWDTIAPLPMSRPILPTPPFAAGASMARPVQLLRRATTSTLPNGHGPGQA